MSSVELPRPLVNQLLHYAQINPEQEICGLISGKQGVLQQCHPISNTADQPQQHFAMDNSQLVNTLRQIREQNEELLAIFHSRLNAPAEPSSADMKEDQYPDVMKLIISLNTDGVLEMQAFYTCNGKIEPVELTLTHGDG
ncbi:Mov34/MPN/PAD-1 family protein [hydrothermal vent metagenome]|uniref:Mov34/MPN/PAD-1 family protein n=1 Tax=hydrothermal vent metagenome TaxID=652676 RepID=A0A3B0ZL78_9ZZZZ